MRTTVLVAPAGRGVGITTACLGIVRALDREGIRVAFAKPVANREPDHTIPLLSLGAHFAIPPAVPRGEAEGLLAAGDDQTLMERVVAIADQAGEDVDVLIVQGMHPEMGMVHSTRVNALMLKALDAELVLVAAPSDQTAEEVAETVAIAARGFGALSDGRSVGARIGLRDVAEGDHDPGRQRRRVVASATSRIAPSARTASATMAIDPSSTRSVDCCDRPPNTNRPSVPAAANAPSVALPMVCTAATRPPAQITGAARGSRTRRSSCRSVMPMPWAASTVSAGTPARPA